VITYFERLREQAVELLAIGLSGEVPGCVEDHTIPDNVRLEPRQLGLQGHQTGRQHLLRGTRRSGQEPGLVGQQVTDKKMVLLEPSCERALG